MKNKWFRRFAVLLTVSLFVGFWFCLPDPLFNDPNSTVIDDKNGRLLGAKIADDGQWRFPNRNSVPEKFIASILTFEDRYFFKHPGVNLFSLFRASWQNIQAGEVVSGGSTLSMQVIRLSRKGKPRTITEKIIEMMMAIRLEIRFSKDEILALYASHAPFGGNVVGLDAAAWRYFKRPPIDLSWAETATLAVLPNAPSLIYPGKNQIQLFNKRNRLLTKLLDQRFIDSIDYELALMENLPLKPHPINHIAPHLLTKVYVNEKGKRIKTTIDIYFQQNVSAIVNRHHKKLIHNEIYNAAAIVVEVESGKIISYVGNVPSLGKDHCRDVDMITSQRSTGSILKPILYAAMLDDGLMLPNTLIPDIPTQIGGFNPMNFDREYAGAVPAQQALYRSLNIPAVKMLQTYGVPRFKKVLMDVGMTSLSQPADYYGLSLILGGAETNMLNLAKIYSNFSRVLNHFYDYSHQYNPADYHPIFYKSKKDHDFEEPFLQNESILSAASLWFTYEAMRKVNRPEDLSGWETFSSTDKIAWKTGTSFGHRDAWAVGTTPEYVVVVWVGNADGEGRPGLTGVSCAAPIMFDVFNLLPETKWFDPPYDELTETAICRSSGHRAGLYCDPIDTTYIQTQGLNTESCPYHQLIHLDPTKSFRVTDICYDPSEMMHKSWFVLPPVIAWYYKKKNPMYQPLPPFSENCMNYNNKAMDFVYPGNHSRLYIPINIEGELESVVLELAHRTTDASVFWYLDNNFLGQTNRVHKMKIQPDIGAHTITVIDNQGNQLVKQIEILSRNMSLSRN